MWRDFVYANCGSLPFAHCGVNQEQLHPADTLPWAPPVWVLLVSFKSFVNVVLWYLKLLQTGKLCGRYKPCHAPYYTQLSCYYPTISLNCVSMSLLRIEYIFIVVFYNAQYLRIYLLSVVNNNKYENKTILTSLLVFLTVKNKILSEKVSLGGGMHFKMGEKHI